MAAEALPRKYRPRTFEQVVGQDLLVKYCQARIKRGERRNLLVAGPWGSGKTTTARIYAQALQCFDPTATGSPCQVCESCQYYQTDPISHPDYREFDGASQGKIDQIREVLNDAKKPPILSKFRLILIDECHGLSRQAFDAMLKPLEEPPPFLCFTFMTTELQNVRPAIKSRCANLEVKLLPNALARQHLEHICQLEGIPYEGAALDLLVYLSKGHPRDLLQNLEQVADFGEVTLDLTKQIFSLDFTAHLVAYLKALFDKDPTAQLKAIANWNAAPSHKAYTLQEFFHYLYFTGVLGAALPSANPLYNLIPEGDRRAILNRFRERAEQGSISIPHLWQAIGIFWADVPLENLGEASLNWFLTRFDYLVNAHNFTVDTYVVKEKISVGSSPLAKPKRAGRVVTQFGNPKDAANLLLAGGSPPPAFVKPEGTVPTLPTAPIVTPVVPSVVPSSAPVAPPTASGDSQIAAAPAPILSPAEAITPSSVGIPPTGPGTNIQYKPPAQPAPVAEISFDDDVDIPVTTRRASSIPALKPEATPPKIAQVFPHHLNHLNGFGAPQPYTGPEK